MSTDDASATYRGYRRQALYALFRLFDDGLSESRILQPEGKEDLAIYDFEGNLVEIVQVKDHSDNLTVSSFKSSFYDRIVPYCAPNSTTLVRIASFGPIGPDLRKALSGDDAAKFRTLKTLTKYRTEHMLNQSDRKRTAVAKRAGIEARNIIDHIVLCEVDESVLTKTLGYVLSKTITCVNPHQSFELLMWWLLTSSEAKLKISREKAVAKLENIGRFLAQREAYCDEWHTTILPVAPSIAGKESVDSMANEFFQGGRVRFDHIEENLDVPREIFLTRIHDAFSENNVVVIHSASGQGKTTLAYRYMKDFAASDFRFEVLTSSDLKHARQIALALTGHAEAVEVPTLIFFDVRPGDNYWSEVVTALASVVGLRILVAIREEDWMRARISAADFFFGEIQLSFEKPEAAAIYERLSRQTKRIRYLDFEDAWSQFGARKTLFEFVYYVTQEESLAGRISSQIDLLQDATIQGHRSKGELDLLRLVAVASAYEARLDLAKLLDYCQLSAPTRTIELFNNEYLIRVSDDGRYVEGYHSIRSEIIADKITDPVVCPWFNAACQILPLLVEDDLQNFLLCSFSRKPHVSGEIIAALMEFQPTTWVGVNGVAMSLMWNGVRDYVAKNSNLLDEVFQFVGSGWYFVLDWDLGQVLGTTKIDLVDQLARVSPRFVRAADFARLARTRQTDKNNVFSNMRSWLQCAIMAPAIPPDAQNFSAMGELLFWIGHLQIVSSLTDAVNEELIDKAKLELPIFLFGEFVRGVRTCSGETYNAWLAPRRAELILYLRTEATIVKLDETDETVVAHFAIDIERQASVLRGRVDALQVTLHDLAIERIILLCNLLPGKLHYGAIGYGHQISFLKQIWDESNKPAVPVENLYATWLPRFNALARGYAEHRYRPEDWTDYFTQVQLLRQKILAVLEHLQETINEFGTSTPLPGTASLERIGEWDECRQGLGNPLFLPKASVDEWGYISENSTTDDNVERIARFSGLSRIAPVRQAVDGYIRQVNQFISHAGDCLVLIPNLRAARSEYAKEAVRAAAAALGISDVSIRLSVVDGFDACIAIDKLKVTTETVFGSKDMLRTDLDFCDREREEFVSMLTAWSMFVDEDARKQVLRTTALKKTRTNYLKSKRTDIDALIASTRSRLKNSLLALRKKGIKAHLLSEKILWNGLPALWITFDTSHPIDSLRAGEIVWHQLIEAFEPDRQKIVRIKAIDLLWQSIVLVPLVQGKSLEKHVFPHFKSVTYIEPPNLEQLPWILLSEKLSEDMWAQLGLPHWELPLTPTGFDLFVSAYSSLTQHVEHISDFSRLPRDVDDFGMSLLQSYLDVETTRLQPLAQDVFDCYNAVLTKFVDINDQVIDSRPNLVLSLKVFIDLKTGFAPALDLNEHFTLTLEKICDWRDRLVVGISNIALVKYLWLADSLNCGYPSDV